MDGRSGCSSNVPSLPPPCPRSPPEYPDLYGKRREAARVQMLEREISFLEEELKFVNSRQPASQACKEVTEFVVAKSDPLIPTTKKKRKPCRFWKWLSGLPCFSFSWICCCCYSLCPLHLEMPSCCCNCSSCGPCNCSICGSCNCSACGSCNCSTCGSRKCSTCGSCNCSSCGSRKCKSCFQCSVPKPRCCSCPRSNCCKEVKDCFQSCYCCWCPRCSCSFWIPSCPTSNCCRFRCSWPKCSKAKLNCFSCKGTCCSCSRCYTCY